MLFELLQIRLAFGTLLIVSHLESFPEVSEILLNLTVYNLNFGYLLLYILRMLLGKHPKFCGGQLPLHLLINNKI